SDIALLVFLPLAVPPRKCANRLSQFRGSVQGGHTFGHDSFVRNGVHTTTDGEGSRVFQRRVCFESQDVVSGRNERYPDTVEAGGSIPSAPINNSLCFNLLH